jgi:hypothetical protein
MYNPYGTFRSWLCNFLISNVASWIDPHFTAEVCIIESDRYLNSRDFDWRNQEIVSAAERGGSLLRATLSLFFMGIAVRLHNASYMDLCLEVTRIYLNAVEQYK